MGFAGSQDKSRLGIVRMVKKKSMKMPRPGVCLETRDYKEPESSTLGWSSLPCSPNPGYGGVVTNQVNASNTEDKTLQGQLGGVNMEATDIVSVTTDKTETSKRDVTHEISGDAVTPSQGLEDTTSTCSTLVGSS